MTIDHDWQANDLSSREYIVRYRKLNKMLLINKL